MKQSTVVITSAELCQNNVFEFVKEISKMRTYGGHINLLAKDHINFYRRYNHGPQSLNELKAFVIEKVFNDPEAYLFQDDYKSNNGILIKQVTPLSFLYEFVNKQSSSLAQGCYAAQVGEGPGLLSEIKIECDSKLVTSNPQEMRNTLESMQGFGLFGLN